MRIIFLFCVLSVSVIVHAQATVKLDEVNKHIGDSVKVCGLVYDTYYAVRTDNTPTFLNIGAKYPNQLLTVVIWADVRKLLNNKPEEEYLNKKICVSGKIELYKGKPQIVIQKPSQISVLSE